MAASYSSRKIFHLALLVFRWVQCMNVVWALRNVWLYRWFSFDILFYVWKVWKLQRLTLQSNSISWVWKKRWTTKKIKCIWPKSVNKNKSTFSRYSILFTANLSHCIIWPVYGDWCIGKCKLVFALGIKWIRTQAILLIYSSVHSTYTLHHCPIFRVLIVPLLF